MNEVQAFYERYTYPHLGSYKVGLGPDQQSYKPGNAPTNFKGNILVAACGTVEACMVAQVNPQSFVLGVDFSSASIKIAKSIKRKGKISNLMLHRGDLTNFQVNIRFDLILANCCLHHIPDVDAALKNLAVLLKPEGVIRGTLYSKKSRPATIRHMNDVFVQNGFTVKEAIHVLSEVKDPWFEKYNQHPHEVADTWLNPYFVEYDVGSAGELLHCNGLEPTRIEDSYFISFEAKRRD